MLPITSQSRFISKFINLCSNIYKMTDKIVQVYINHNKNLSTSHTVYDITTISNLNSLQSFKIVQRRYKDFLRFHSKMSSAIRMLPSFPGKTILRPSGTVVSRREKMFNIYLAYVCDLMCKKEEKWESEVVKFLCEDEYK